MINNHSETVEIKDFIPDIRYILNDLDLYQKSLSQEIFVINYDQFPKKGLGDRNFHIKNC
jgi:hypothetical protein